MKPTGFLIMGGIILRRCELTDNEVIAIFLAQLNAGMTALGHTVLITQANQPTLQGAVKADSMYFYKIGDKRIGHPHRINRWDTLAGEMVDNDVQLMESTYQVSALVRQPAPLTASDMLNDVAMIMQSDSFIKVLKANGIGILRIGEIRNPYFKDDRDQFQAMPSFDFIVSYNRSINRTGKVISAYDLDIKRV